MGLRLWHWAPFVSSQTDGQCVWSSNDVVWWFQLLDLNFKNPINQSVLNTIYLQAFNTVCAQCTVTVNLSEPSQFERSIWKTSGICQIISYLYFPFWWNKLSINSKSISTLLGKFYFNNITSRGPFFKLSAQSLVNNAKSTRISVTWAWPQQPPPPTSLLQTLTKRWPKSMWRFAGGCCDTHSYRETHSKIHNPLFPFVMLTNDKLAEIWIFKIVNNGGVWTD